MVASKRLCVSTTWWGGDVIVYANNTWGKAMPMLKQVIGSMTPKEFCRFLDGTGARLGWTYQWL